MWEAEAMQKNKKYLELIDGRKFITINVMRPAKAKRLCTPRLHRRSIWLQSQIPESRNQFDFMTETPR